MYILVHQINVIVTRVDSPDEDVVKEIGGGSVRWSPMSGLKLQPNEFAEAPMTIVNRLERMGFKVVAMTQGCDKMAWTMHRANGHMSRCSSIPSMPTQLASLFNDSAVCGVAGNERHHNDQDDLISLASVRSQASVRSHNASLTQVKPHVKKEKPNVKSRFGK